MHPRRTLPLLGKTLLAFAALELMTLDLHAATQVWDAGGTGAFSDSTKYNAGAGPAPVAGDDVTSDGTGSVINFGLGDTITLNTLNLNMTSGASVFNQTDGALSLTTLGFGGAGGSRNPTYNLSGGTLNISNAFTWGNGTNARFLQSGGTVNYSGASYNMGITGGARGFVTLTNGAVFNANSVAQLNIGNSGPGNGQGTISLSNTSQFNATSGVLSLGQQGAATGTNSFGVLTMADTSTVNVSEVVLGGNNATFSVFGVVNLNGGTLSTGSIRRGFSSIPSSSTAQVLHANGGTVRAVTHANNANFFNGIFVDVQAGGLTVDTNGNAVTITNSMSGVGGLTKTGAGTLTLSGVSTYTGVTGIQAGTVRLGVNDAINVASNVRLSGGRLGFSTGNFSQGTTVAVGLGTLDLDATSILDFGDGNQLLHFANSSAEAWAGTLEVYNWDGALDNLYFSTDNNGLTVGQLAQINFYSGDGTGFLGVGAWAGADGEVMVVIPEPSTYALLIVGLLFFWLQRRKRSLVEA
jgi:fibronectin-binding autotransporter adhesin